MSAGARIESVWIESVGFAAPGMPDWPIAQAVLRGEQAAVGGELPAYQPGLLPANERRRASPTVRMAFRVAEAAIRASSVAADELATVFASADGDLDIAQRICTALAETPRFVSPTDFHNSVHNAAAGYWSIASRARGPSTAIAASDDSFAAGLMEALGMAHVERQATLLVAYDVPAPELLLARRLVRYPVGVSLILTPQCTPNSQASVTIQPTQEPATTLQDAALEALRTGNPAARALPLLALLARRRSGSAVLQLPNGNRVAVLIDMEDRT